MGSIPYLCFIVVAFWNNFLEKIKSIHVRASSWPMHWYIPYYSVFPCIYNIFMMSRCTILLKIHIPPISNKDGITNIMIYEFSDVILDPNSKIYITWMSCTAMAVLYNLWVIPLRSTFPYQTKSNRVIWMTFDYIADIIYLIDMIFIQPRVKYLCDGFWVVDIKSLRKKYIKSKRFKVNSN